MKVMFICTGNICRSAMAEGYLKKRIENDNLDTQVYSSGIYAENGEEASEFAKKVMLKYNVDLSSHRATNIANSPIEDMDLILCATVSHKKSTRKIIS